MEDIKGAFTFLNSIDKCNCISLDSRGCNESKSNNGNCDLVCPGIFIDKDTEKRYITLVAQLAVGIGISKDELDWLQGITRRKSAVLSAEKG